MILILFGFSLSLGCDQLGLGMVQLLFGLKFPPLCSHPLSPSLIEEFQLQLSLEDFILHSLLELFEGLELDAAPLQSLDDRAIWAVKSRRTEWTLLHPVGWVPQCIDVGL